ncbi:hypothetical protein [Hymenobacter latericus]|uniref:hypothetical protein n=1 Tax=Hymenobacter sp. YIM 151858-1 TaxID=2987688 RepID=UPI002225E40F|nr:hypothetical protein [Hymenobacter sp. YIM 151858-1]UYZ58539.1 hypothetical protein OIS50_15945 [Hymenobacter sp. YIM 151858-1]
MKRSTLWLALLAGSLTLGTACSGNDNQRTDGTAGEAVSDMDKAADEGGVQSDAVVIDNNAGPTVSADADSAAQAGAAGDTSGAANNQ